jgi:hypothetical protein
MTETITPYEHERSVFIIEERNVHVRGSQPPVGGWLPYQMCLGRASAEKALENLQAQRLANWEYRLRLYVPVDPPAGNAGPQSQ